MEETLFLKYDKTEEDKLDNDSEVLPIRKCEEEENKQFKISEVLPEEQQEEDKEFIILKIYNSEIDKAIEDLKEHKKINQYYKPDYKLIVERYTDKILDVYGWYESLKQTIRTTDRTSMLERDEL